jgi:hypothetical protein
MNTGGRIAAGLAAAYTLGRFRKLRWGLAVAAYAAGKRVGQGGGDLGGSLTSNPLVKGLTSQLGGRLADVGKTAATAVASRRIEAMSSRVESMASSLRGPATDAGSDSAATDAAGEADSPARDDERKPRRSNGDRPGRRPQNTADRDAADQEPANSGRKRRAKAEGEPTTRSTSTKQRSSSRSTTPAKAPARRASGRGGSSARKE